MKMKVTALVVLLAECAFISAQIVFDDTPGYGRVFDGIGGISGGGVTFLHLKSAFQ